MFGKKAGSKEAGGTSRSADEKNRIRRRQIIVVSSSLLFSLLYTLGFWLNQAFCTPVELYHRVWQTTGNFFYERDKLTNWRAWEHKYDSSIKNQKDAEEDLQIMLKSLNDSFTTFYDARATSRQSDAHEGFYSGVGMVMNGKTHPVTVRRVMPGSAAERGGVQPGDQILSVDGIDCSRLEPSKIGDHTRERMYHPVQFMLKRAGQELSLTLVPSKIALVSTVPRRLADNIAYERIDAFNRGDLAKIVEKDFRDLQNCRALILDLRGNGGGGVDLCLEIVSSMMEEGPLVSLRSRSTKSSGEDSYLTTHYTLTPTEMLVADDVDGRKKAVAHRRRMIDFWRNKPIVVLVDQYSASAAEMVAAALSENKRADLIGERTFGKGVAQIYFPMPWSSCVAVTAGRYFTPNGRWLGDGQELTDAQRASASGKLRGIEPRYMVPADKDLVYGEANDNQLQFAIDLLRKNENSKAQIQVKEEARER